MVRPDMVYLFIGDDSVSKNLKIKALRQEVLQKNTEQFNLDTLYASQLCRRDLQEKLIYLPVKSSRRFLVIKEAQNLKEEAREFILQYIQRPNKQVILVLDVSRQGKSQGFITHLQKYSRTIRFKETRPPDTFTLSRSIDLRKPDAALRLLNQLLKDGERPERILGGLRYAWEKDTGSAREMRKRLRLLLNCDIEIKTGRLKPLFALEKLVIGLCSLG
jgi:DNA polymerase III delta subunit